MVGYLPKLSTDREETLDTASFRELVETAQQDGWASGSLNLQFLNFYAHQLGYTAVPVRKGAGDVVELRPTPANLAHERSLSAIVGLGEQPLHTDGAHLQKPPDIVVLHAANPNAVPTLLWSPLNKLSNPLYPVHPAPAHTAGGLFLVGSGGDRFLASAYEDGKYRYDPGCMTPCDERARATADYFESARGNAYRHEWNEQDQILVIDNRVTLHGRADASGDTDRVITRAAYHLKAEA